jgi:hypothetical protein
MRHEDRAMPWKIQLKFPVWLQDYNRDFAFVVIAGAILLMLYMRADVLIGAVGLKATYFFLGIAIFWGMGLVILALLVVWKNLSIAVAVGVGTVVSLLSILVNIKVILVGWIIGIVVYSLPTLFPLVIAGFSILMWLGTRFQPSLFSRGLLQMAVVGLLVFTAMFCLGIGVLPRNAEFDFRGNLNLRGHHYFLAQYDGWLGDPDTLVLYECNSIGILCNEVYKSTPGGWNRAFVGLVTDEQDGTVTITVDLQDLYTHKP